MVADMLCGAIGCIGFSWVTETFLYSCIWLSISKLVHIWSVWHFHLHFGRVVSGCQPSLHRARDSDVRLAWEDASAAWVFYSWDTWPWRWCHSGNGHLYVFVCVHCMCALVKHLVGYHYQGVQPASAYFNTSLKISGSNWHFYTCYCLKVSGQIDFESLYVYTNNLVAPVLIFITSFYAIDLLSLPLSGSIQQKIGRKLPFNVSSTGRQRWQWWCWDCFVWKKAKH